MFINEVETIVGLSKKSIRYYEEMGLIKPKRNNENSYRIYTTEDITKLRVIKFLRELDVSIRDIKLLSEQKLSLQECMNDRINKITKEIENYQKIKDMCIEIAATTTSFEILATKSHLKEMNILNKEGFTMRNTKTNKTKKIQGACLSSLIFSTFFISIAGIISYFQFTEKEKIPWLIYGLLIVMFLIPIISILYNLITRIKEIKEGEEDEASKY